MVDDQIKCQYRVAIYNPHTCLISVIIIIVNKN